MSSLVLLYHWRFVSAVLVNVKFGKMPQRVLVLAVGLQHLLKSTVDLSLANFGPEYNTWQNLEVESVHDFVCSILSAVVDPCSAPDSHYCSLDFGTIQAGPVAS